MRTALGKRIEKVKRNGQGNGVRWWRFPPLLQFRRDQMSSA